MYFFCKTEWRKFQTIAIQHLFHPPELNRGVCGNPSNAGSWKIALKHANSWKGRRMKCYWDFHLILHWNKIQSLYLNWSTTMIALAVRGWLQHCFCYTTQWGCRFTGQDMDSTSLSHRIVFALGFFPKLHGTSKGSESRWLAGCCLVESAPTGFQKLHVGA